MDILEGFKNVIKSEYFEELKNVPKIVLTESKQPNCNFTIEISNDQNHFLMIKNLEDLKVNAANYILKDPPKDCDYIILDLINKIVYIIDLKNKKKCDGPSQLQQQLIAGEAWLSHLCFCVAHENILDLDDWKVYWAILNYRKGRVFTKTTPKVYYQNPTLKRPFPLFEVNRIILERLKIK